MNFRLLTTGHKHASENMAIDEAVLNAIADGQSPPTLRLYGWSPPAISIGYFQSMQEEVDLEVCKKYGVAVVRRITGGGAVLHDAEITYSIHIPLSAALVPDGILESYLAICNGLLKGLSRMGIEAKFVPLNDIITEHLGSPRKISGNAQTRKRGVILQHGTLLLKVDIDKMFELLKVPSEKMKGKLIEDVKQRVTSVSDKLGQEVSFEEAQTALIQGFKEAFTGSQFTPGSLSKIEEELAQKFKKEKYEADVWNMMR